MKERATAKDPIVILSTIDWGFLWQRHQILATHFANTGHRVIFVESLGFGPRYLDPSFYARAAGKLLRKVRHVRPKVQVRELPRNLTVYTPIVAPPRPRALRPVNRRILVPRVLREIASMGVRNPLVWSYQPTGTALEIARGLEPKALVYDCVSNFAQVPGIPRDVHQTEQQWLDTADLVLVDSYFLRQKHCGRRPDLVQLPPGVDYELFNQAYLATDPGTPVRRVCFFGTLGAPWFDFDLVQAVASAGYKVSLIGHKGAHHRLFEHPNVEYTPSVPQTELPGLLKSMDAFLIPYKMSEFTQGVFPSKVYECLATGKPVLAVPLPDLQRDLSEYIYLADDASGFIDVLRRLPDSETREKVRLRLEMARKNSWQGRFDMVLAELERILLHA